MTVRSKAFTHTFDGEDVDHVRTYMQMHSGTGKSFKDEYTGVNYTDLLRGDTVFVFNLTPDLSGIKL